MLRILLFSGIFISTLVPQLQALLSCGVELPGTVDFRPVTISNVQVSAPPDMQATLVENPQNARPSKLSRWRKEEAINWYEAYEGRIPPSSNEQKPNEIYDQNVGSYNLSLAVANTFGQHTKKIIVCTNASAIGFTEIEFELFMGFPNPEMGLLHIEFPANHTNNYHM